MPLRIIVHADDIGISREGTDRILQAHDTGALSSVSIMPNGPAFDYAIDEIKKRPGLRVSVHLNLLEGGPVSAAGAVDLLVDSNGRFFRSFPGLWIKYGLSDSSGKRILRQQVKTEMRAQIGKVAGCLEAGAQINVDSHNHYHMIPFVFDALLELSEEFNIRYIRIPEEKFFWCFEGWRWLSRYFGTGMIKHFLLNVLSKGRKARLNALGIGYPSHFIGVLFSGYMTGAIVRSALGSLERRSGTVEILFHPWRAGAGEIGRWGQERFGGYYCSPSRDDEFNALTEPAFKQLIESVSGV